MRVRDKQVRGGFVPGGDTYRIDHYDRMEPFLMNVTSDTDLWMFLASGGGLTAGRVDAERALFPYVTVDRLHDAHHHTGPVTLIRTGTPADPVLWRPFHPGPIPAPAIERRLSKDPLGTGVTFEERHAGLGLRVRARWAGCHAFGWVRTVWLENLGKEPVALEVLDGVRNVLPHGAPLALYQQSSSLIDAYKRTDLDPTTGLAMMSLTARIVDRAEAAEELRANTVFGTGPDGARVSVAPEAPDRFAAGGEFPVRSVTTGVRGAYHRAAAVTLTPGEVRSWHLALDAGLDHGAVTRLRRSLTRPDLAGRIEAELRAASERLAVHVQRADGTQVGRDRATVVHHRANTLFNIMRGGVFTAGPSWKTGDVRDFLRTRNRGVAERHAGMLDAMPAGAGRSAWLEAARAAGDPDLERLVHEYLPIFFGRRHGDPSRPWNRFRISLHDPDDGERLYYEGNWRDLFQNWEALAVSFPGYLPSMIARFVNASTADGFNPYRITRDGVEWETVDPDDPWSYIGYWGDHQIIYLLKFLEAQARIDPDTLHTLLERPIFSFADVPYRLAPYAELLRDPHDTITFDAVRDAAIADRVGTGGTDGRLLHDARGAVHHVTLWEKLLVPALAKLSNFVPGGGIWMNTQRPEWNDANNALVGRGLSMVTLAYLRRYLAFLQTLEKPHTLSLSANVARWLEAVAGALERHAPEAAGAEAGRALLDALGEAFSAYRAELYAHGMEPPVPVEGGRIEVLCGAALAHLDRTLGASRRADGLYHSYNLLQAAPDGDALHVQPLYEMLEGQVAVLSAGVLEPAEAADLVETLFASALYREDQESFMLYPERALPGFLEKNLVPADAAGIPLVRDLLAEGNDDLVAADADGTLRFHGAFANADDVNAALDRLAADPTCRERVERDRPAVLELWETVFHHHAFTGRSGTMYAYEGLGSIYWHMVAKLLLAVQENALAAREHDPDTAPRLAVLYHRIRDGLGFRKSPAGYGAFPCDPYSHTPAGHGARQPGMTGQVKEEILTRFGELGVAWHAGTVRFSPWLLPATEFLDAPATLTGTAVDGGPLALPLEAGCLGFTLAQVPVIYRRTGGETWIRVTTAEGVTGERPEPVLTPAESRELAARTGTVTRIEVGIPEGSLFGA